jgi:AraC-like DNA-binding protein
MSPLSTGRLVDVLNEPDTQRDSYREWAAAEPGVACRWRQDVPVDLDHRVVPDGCADIIVNDGRAVAVGLADTSFVHPLRAGSSCVGLRLRPEAVVPVLGVAAVELRNASVPLDDVVGTARARQLVDAVVGDAPLRVEPTRQVADALALLRTQTVDHTAQSMGLSGRHLRRLLVHATGLGPKDHQRVRRFRAFLASAEGGAPLAVAAAEAGYADQPHLTREVRRLSGLTPAALLASRSSSAALRSTPQR